MNNIKFAFVILIAIAVQAISNAQEASNDFKPLFNGKNLDGWVQVNTAPSTWTVRENMIICTGKPIGEIRTNRMYQNFELQLEWRHMVPKGNAGVFIWADDITARGQPFHRGIEVQVLENAYGKADWFTTHGDIFPIHGAKMTPVNGRGGSRAFPTEERSKPSPEWNHYHIKCVDGKIELSVNGKLVTQGTDCNPRKGYICLESEGGVVHYRNIRIKELPDTKIDPSMVAIADRGFRCLYSGVDLSGWKTDDEANWKSQDWVLKHVGSTKSSLVSQESYGDCRFIFDVRWLKDSNQAVIEVRGEKPAISITSTEIKTHLEEVGNWNRFEGTLKDDHLTLIVNGKTAIENASVKELPSSGPLRIIAEGPIDFANIYVSEFKKR